MKEMNPDVYSSYDLKKKKKLESWRVTTQQILASKKQTKFIKIYFIMFK